MKEKIPPQHLESEQAVLGSMMMSKDAIAVVIGKLRPEHFYKPAHEHIYKSIVDLYKSNQPIDLLTVSNAMQKAGTLESSGGRVYLADILDTVPTAANAEKYAEIVFEKALLRMLIDTGSHIIKNAFDDTQEVNDVMDMAQKRITDITKEGVSDDFVHLKEVLNTVFDNIQSAYDSEDKILGISSGIPDLDAITSGFQPGDLIILAARPSMGKTTLAMNFAAHAAINKKVAVAVFSCEMPKEQLAMRLLCSEARLDSGRLRTSNLLDHEYRDLNQAFGKLAESPIYIDDTPGISPLQMRAKVRRLQLEADIKLIVIDYMQLMRGSSKKNESRFHEVSEIVREGKAFAKESKIPIIALSQLSRDIEKRQDKRPMLSDLRETGEMEQTADLVMFIHREEGYAETKQSISAVQLVIAKQRNGPTGDIPLIFKRDISKFVQGTKEVAPESAYASVPPEIR
jgi:replicative DNA helicase